MTLSQKRATEMLQALDNGREHALDDLMPVVYDELRRLAGRDIDLLALDDALNELEALDPQKARIVELRFFSGLSIDETAEAIAVSSPTIIRQWRLAKAWLFRQIRKEAATDSGTDQKPVLN